GLRLDSPATPTGRRLWRGQAARAATAGLAPARAGRRGLVPPACPAPGRGLVAGAPARQPLSGSRAHRQLRLSCRPMINDPFQRLGLDRQALSVSQLNNRARLLLEDVF